MEGGEGQHMAYVWCSGDLSTALLDCYVDHAGCLDLEAVTF